MNRSRRGHVFFNRGYATDRGTSKSRSVVSSATTVSTATALFRDLTIRNDNVLSCVDENTVRVRFLIVKSDPQTRSPCDLESPTPRPHNDETSKRVDSRTKI